MASITSLPNEILHGILRLLMPESFEEAALTCKALYASSGALRDDHNRLRRRFRHFRYSIAPRRTPRAGSYRYDGGKASPEGGASASLAEITINTPTQLMQVIASEPIAARYIQTADFRDDALSGTIEGFDDEVEGPFIEGDKTGLLRLLGSSSYLAEVAGATPEVWMGKMDETLEGHADVFLLTLLPNVTRLVPSSRYGRRENIRDECWELMDVIVRRANDPCIPTASLSKLDIIEPNATCGLEVKRNLAEFSPLLAIDSLRAFHGTSCVGANDDFFGISYSPRYSTFGKGLKEIVLHGSILGPNTASTFASAFQGLETFRLAWETKRDGFGWEWNMGGTVHTLMKIAGTTLQELSLHSPDSLNGFGATPINMREFERLRILELDIEALTGPALDPDNELSDHDEAPWGDAILPRLVDILPASIEIFRVCISNWMPSHISQLKILLGGMAEERHSKLPCLQGIEFRASDDFLVDWLPPATTATDVAKGEAPIGEVARKIPEELVTFIEACGGTVIIGEDYAPAFVDLGED